MRLLCVRVRLTVGRLMLAVAALALPLAFAARPHPVTIEVSGPVPLIRWTDDTRTPVTGDDPAVVRWREYGPVLAVDWSDGSTSWYWSRYSPWMWRTAEVR